MAAGTNTALGNVVDTVDSATLAVNNEVSRGCKINGLFLSLFFYTEGGELASEVPLVDWYILVNRRGALSGIGNAATQAPVPGAQGTHQNKYLIIHTEKGLAGGGDASLSGVPMVFKGVIVIPRGMRKMDALTKISVFARANFATKFCMQAIYKWYT